MHHEEDIKCHALVISYPRIKRQQVPVEDLRWPIRTPYYKLLVYLAAILLVGSTTQAEATEGKIISCLPCNERCVCWNRKNGCEVNCVDQALRVPPASDELPDALHITSL